MDYLPLSVVVALSIWAWFVLLRKKHPGKLPPGPSPFPIVGNLLQLGQLPHQKLAQLSKTYGPIMSLRLGSVYTVVVSSPEVAKEILQKHDLVFGSRTIPSVAQAHDHHKMSVAFLPVGDEWRKIRKISKEQMFSVSRLEASRELRREKLEKLFNYVQRCSDRRQVVNVGEAAFIVTLNLLSASLFSMEVADFDSVADFKTTFENLVDTFGAPNFADYFPVLRPLDLQGIKKKSELYFGKVLDFLQDIIDKRMKARKANPNAAKKDDMLETLLDHGLGKEYNFSFDDIKHILLEFFVAGTHTTAKSTEWVMTELLIHPEKWAKAKEELRTVIGDRELVQESDIPKLPYLNAAIKETLRCHTPGPFLIPRKPGADVEVNGYTIPKGTQLIINAWAVCRSSSRWENPDSFEPERFLETKKDFKGQDFEFIPFGAGRRICPGMSLADRMLHLVVGTLIHNFNWKIQSQLKPGEVENAEKFGIALSKAVPLMATPFKV